MDTDLRTTTFEHFDTWNEGEIQTELCTTRPCSCPSVILGTDCEFGNYQNLNFVNQCDGTLFLVATHNNLAVGLGDDFVDLFRVENGAGNAVRITKVAKKHVFCSYNGPNHCNLDAAGGVYVDPAGQLYLYGTEHDNDGPSVDGGAVVPAPGGGSTRIACVPGPECSVKFEEFRPIPHNTCSRIQDAWVELYDDDDFSDRSLMIDFVDRNLEDYSNYDRTEGFEDKTSSVRWCLPPGAFYRLYKDKEPCSGDTRDLVGTGSLESRSDFFNDEPSCSKWMGGPFADAGPDRLGECTSHTTTPMVPDGSASSAVEEGASLTFFWEAPGVTFDDATSATPTGQFPKGTTIATLTVASGGATHSDTTEVRIVDTEPPEITCPAALTAECSAAGGSGADDTVIAAFLEDAMVSDLCDPDVEVSTDVPALLPLGDSLVTFTATDDESLTDSCQTTVTVQDTTAPVIDPSFAITPASMEPPDHELISMNVSDVVALEVCDSEPVLQCSVVSDEPPDAPLHDGNTLFDIVLDGEQIFTQGTGVRTIDSNGAIGEFALALRRERSGVSDGRDYTTSCFGIDASGNVGAPESTKVHVPLRAKKK